MKSAETLSFGEYLALQGNHAISVRLTACLGGRQQTVDQFFYLTDMLAKDLAARGQVRIPSSRLRQWLAFLGGRTSDLLVPPSPKAMPRGMRRGDPRETGRRKRQLL